MTAQRGRDLLLKIDMDGTGRFETFAGLRATRLAFEAATIDVTTVESDEGWRELLGGGVKAATFSGGGVFRDAETDERARGLFFAGTVANYRAIIPGFGTMTGPFQITAFEVAGGHDDEVSYEITLASAGALSFEAVQ